MSDAIEAEAVEMPDVPPDVVEAATPDPDALVPTGTDVDIYRRMELEDERQIMDELQGRALEVMLYSFEQGGKAVTGFSWKGAAEAVNTMNRRGYTGIRISPEHEPRFEEATGGDGEPVLRCVVYAEDTQHGSGVWGVAQQPKKMKKGGDKVPDPFAPHKALSKAQRNAFERLIPLELVEYLKAQFHGEGRVKTIPGAVEAKSERPPALTDDRAKEQVATLRAVYDEIKDLDRLVMPPGQFNTILLGAQHDHDRLDDAIAHLEGFRDGELEIHSLRERLRQSIPKGPFERETVKLIGMNQEQRKARLCELLAAAEGTT